MLRAYTAPTYVAPPQGLCVVCKERKAVAILKWELFIGKPEDTEANAFYESESGIPLCSECANHFRQEYPVSSTTAIADNQEENKT